MSKYRICTLTYGDGRQRHNPERRDFPFFCRWRPVIKGGCETFEEAQAEIEKDKAYVNRYKVIKTEITKI